MIRRRAPSPSGQFLALPFSGHFCLSPLNFHCSGSFSPQACHIGILTMSQAFILKGEPLSNSLVLTLGLTQSKPPHTQEKCLLATQSSWQSAVLPTRHPHSPHGWQSFHLSSQRASPLRKLLLDKGSPSHSCPPMTFGTWLPPDRSQTNRALISQLLSSAACKAASIFSCFYQTNVFN